MRRGYSALGSTQLRGARGWIVRNVLLACHDGPTRQDLKAWRGSGDFGQVPRAAAGRCALREEILDDAIFERMERHHYEPSAGLEYLLGGGKRALELVELFIDQDTQ